MLQLSGITKNYGTRQVLDNVSFTVANNRLTGFVGGNGAGKTTTMRIILGVLAADVDQVVGQLERHADPLAEPDLGVERLHELPAVNAKFEPGRHHRTLGGAPTGESHGDLLPQRHGLGRPGLLELAQPGLGGLQA